MECNNGDSMYWTYDVTRWLLWLDCEKVHFNDFICRSIGLSVSISLDCSRCENGLESTSVYNHIFIFEKVISSNTEQQ